MSRSFCFVEEMRGRDKCPPKDYEMLFFSSKVEDQLCFEIKQRGSAAAEISRTIKSKEEGEQARRAWNQLLSALGKKQHGLLIN